MRKVLLAVASVGVLALGTVPAHAAITHIQLGPRAGVFSPTRTAYHVGVDCPTTDEWRMDVTLKQGSHTETQTTPWVPCHGTDVGDHSGYRQLIYTTGFHVGDGQAFGSARTRDEVSHVITDGPDTAQRAVRFIQCPCE